jgi:hypothetical protein
VFKRISFLLPLLLLLFSATALALSRSGTIVSTHPTNGDSLPSLAADGKTVTVATGYTAQDGMQADQEVEHEYELIRNGQVISVKVLGSIFQVPPYSETFHSRFMTFVDENGDEIEIEEGDRVEVTWKFKDYQGVYRVISKTTGMIS